MARRSVQLYAIFVTAAAMAALAWAIIARTGGQLVYVLDDPYIHLAVAETILGGGYGINEGELASPSSSILYPFLLAGLLSLGFDTLAPIVLAAGAALWASWIMAGILADHAFEPASTTSRASVLLLIPLALLAVNMFGLPFTGMEHSLHVLTVCLVMAGLLALSREGPAPAALVAGIVLAPLIRFEGLAVSLAALAVLLAYRKFPAALLSAAVLGGSLAAFFLTMTALGLPALPSSVLVKSDVSSALVEGRGPIATAIAQAITALYEARGLLLGLAAAGVLLALSTKGADPQKRLAIAAVALAGLGGHLAAGRFGWFSRYEIYVVMLAILALAILWCTALTRPVDREGARLAGLTALLAVVAMPYNLTTSSTPAASENIFQQQFQMHRFATEYFPHNVAVNDLGYVAFQNDNYVLDLWGLGSEEARQRRLSPGYGPDDMRELTAGKDVSFAMIYDTWLGEFVPPEWCRIAVLRTPQIIAASGEVSFYLIDPALEGEMRQALDAFAPTLPRNTSLTAADC